MYNIYIYIIDIYIYIYYMYIIHIYMETPSFAQDMIYTWWILSISRWSFRDEKHITFEAFTEAITEASLDQDWVTEGNQQRSKEMCHAGCETKMKLCFARSRSCGTWVTRAVYDRSEEGQLDGSVEEWNVWSTCSSEYPIGCKSRAQMEWYGYEM